ncbi:MAG: bile acid:sodium symporter [Spirochaetia bacterium]|jgi:sodium/bile acid cotransporter 7|nr:bile acid:sodium symporter [Spirochaetia bacterium]
MFIIALTLTALCAFLFPSVGTFLYQLGFVVNLCIMAMYFFLGIVVDIKEVKESLSEKKLFFITQVCIFIIAPIIALVTFLVLGNYCSKDSLLGLIFIGCVPTTMTSCIMLTKRYQGNTAAALCNAISSQLVGIFITPLIISFILKTQYQLVQPWQVVIKNLLMRVIIPFSLGQLCNFLAKGKLNKRVPNIISFYGIFVIIYINFSQVVSGNDFNALIGNFKLPIVGTCIICLLQLCITLIMGKATHISFGNRIALIFTGTQKTIGLGIPLSAIFFTNEPSLGMGVNMLLIIYYFLAMVFTSLIVKILIARRKKTDIGPVVSKV